MDLAPPQFGAPRPALSYADRPAAYGLLERGGLLALVHVSLPRRAPFFDLPGGGVDPGEDEARALVREFGEETGLVVRPGALVARARQFMISAKGEPFNSRNGFFETAMEGEDAALKIEQEHVLVWRDPAEALTILRHDSHAWAVTAWLRRRR
ncbi:MAG TPA: NUDIX domain-containing protein [Caulobacteraceae bacterium]|nr:NUDIX domain-containing protein [Caulobacteraceae bacterium]